MRSLDGRWGTALFRKVGELGGEGIVSKRADASYTSGPSSTWLKVKHAAVGAFPVIGYAADGGRIAADPDILLMDEPFSALDPLIRRQLQDQFLEFSARSWLLFELNGLNTLLHSGHACGTFRRLPGPPILNLTGLSSRPRICQGWSRLGSSCPLFAKGNELLRD